MNNRTMSRLCLVLSAAFLAIGACQPRQCASSTSTIGHQSPQPLKLAATEGMWLFNALPVEQLHALGFDPSQSWADHLRLASVHVGGASGAFVSADGLVLTNHHVASSGLQNISHAGKDY